MIRKLKLIAAVITLAAMATACGGGGGSSSPGGPVATSPDQPDVIDQPSNPEAPTDPPAARRDAFACGSGGATLNADQAPGSYVLFESAPVRPLAWSDDGSRLLVTNTPANCLEIYAMEADQFRLEATVMVGMEPVAVAFADAGEAWVVNHLSDSVSIVDLTGVPRVVQTLQVGDEPRDIVFAGPDRNRAFITAAYRGQNHPQFEPQDLLTPGLGRADVWVYQRNQLDRSLNGAPHAGLGVEPHTKRKRMPEQGAHQGLVLALRHCPGQERVGAARGRTYRHDQVAEGNPRNICFTLRIKDDVPRLCSRRRHTAHHHGQHRLVVELDSACFLHGDGLVEHYRGCLLYTSPSPRDS